MLLSAVIKLPVGIVEQIAHLSVQCIPTLNLTREMIWDS